MRTQGFTLVELLMTVTVLGILTALAVPSFRGMMDRNAVTTTANDLLSSILLARSESIKREQPVIFSGNASFTTWQVAVDTNGDGSGDDTLLAHSLDGNGVGVSANVTTHPYQHRAVPKRPFEWRPADCIPDLPWSAGNWRCGNRPRCTFLSGSTPTPSV